jgi:hypothetical protein
MNCEFATDRFLKSVALAVEAMPAWGLNFFACRILFQMDSKDVLGLLAELKASLEAERKRAGLKVVGGKKRRV